MKARAKTSTARATRQAARSGRTGRGAARPNTRRPPAIRAAKASVAPKLAPGLDRGPAPGLDPGVARNGAALRHIGGSQSDEWNDRLGAETVQAMPQLACETREQKMDAALQGLAGIAPRDELEGIMAAQLIAAHAAAMDCYRRAAQEERDGERQDHLNQAARLSRASATLLTALQRCRRNGVREQKSAKQPHARAIPPERATRLNGLRRNEERPDRAPEQTFPKWGSLSDQDLAAMMRTGSEEQRAHARIILAGRIATRRKRAAAAAEAAKAMPVAAQAKPAEQPPPLAPAAESAKQPSAVTPGEGSSPVAPAHTESAKQPRPKLTLGDALRIVLGSGGRLDTNKVQQMHFQLPPGERDAFLEAVNARAREEIHGKPRRPFG
jgi:hypothetical protein